MEKYKRDENVRVTDLRTGERWTAIVKRHDPNERKVVVLRHDNDKLYRVHEAFVERYEQEDERDD